MSDKTLKYTSNGLKILNDLFIRDDAEMQRLLVEERERSGVAMEIYNLRKKHRLTQKKLAEKIGTSATAIARLESANYSGHSHATLQRIAEALGVSLVVKFSDGGEGKNESLSKSAAFCPGSLFHVGNGECLSISTGPTQISNLAVIYTTGGCHGQNVGCIAA